MAFSNTPDTQASAPPGTNTGGGQSGSGVSSPPAPPPPAVADPGSAGDVSLAENVAASLAALGYTGSSMGEKQSSNIVQSASSNMTPILVILGLVLVAFLIMRKRGKV